MKTLKEALFNKKNLDKNRNKYGISEKDMIGQIKDFPVGIVVRMMEERELQYSDADIKVFQLELTGGFAWTETEDGWDFWNLVIRRRNFDLFFKEHPEYERYN